MNEKRFDVLLHDYCEARDDERTFITLQGAMVALGVSAVGALLVFTDRVIDRNSPTGDLTSLPQFPDPMIAAAPFMPLVIIAFATWVGSTATVRAFYMRAVAREIRIALNDGGG